MPPLAGSAVYEVGVVVVSPVAFVLSYVPNTAMTSSFGDVVAAVVPVESAVVPACVFEAVLSAALGLMPKLNSLMLSAWYVQLPL